MMFQDQTDLWHRLHENVTRKNRLRNTMLNNPDGYPGNLYTYDTAQDLTRPGSIRRRPVLRHSTSHTSDVPSIPEGGLPVFIPRARAFTEPTAVVVDPNVRRRHLDSIRDEEEDQSDKSSNASIDTKETRF